LRLPDHAVGHQTGGISRTQNPSRAKGGATID
jgi:hypothetical protein